MQVNTHLYLVRHGQTDWNRSKRLQGQTDVPLNRLGIEQATKLADFLHKNHYKLTAIYTSDLLRASQTAEIIAKQNKVPVIHSSELRERNIGEWEGLTIEEIRNKYDNWEHIRRTGGYYGVEKTISLIKRVRDHLWSIVRNHPREHILVVSHGMIIRSYLNEMTNKGRFWGSNIRNTSITHMVFPPKGKHFIHKFNQTKHL